MLSSNVKSKKKCVEVFQENQKGEKCGKGRRIVELKELGKNLKCLNTGKIENNISHINTAVILGAVHSGVGSTALNKILACSDIPSISNDLYKRYEKIVGEAIENEAKDSCKRAAIEEKDLVIKNITKLCKELPLNIVQDIYPCLNVLTSSPLSNSAVNFELEENSFDKALDQIVNIIVSYDTGWSKRGNGRSYNNLNSYSTIIGFLSGKILDYATRNRKCRKCEIGHKKEDHDCRMNFQGSAKAMEADAGVQLINHSKVLQEVDLQVRVVVGDEDSFMIAAKRLDSLLTPTFFKLLR
ncbi:uncharacterized protein [Temnothorax nylanderi]|uniref:uncharacterized protein isoform X2 n=1 Tax=Temnothorax nylanderi TaxID=102681 RepID=UPI003A84FA32